jgi:CheY-like chemotaxis protein
MILNGKFIFIVDDNPQNHLVFQMALNPQGAWTDFESSGQDAFTRLRQKRKLHLIILDLALSGSTSPYDLYDRIRALPNLVNVPIVAAATADPYQTLHHTRRKGFDGLIFKPIDTYVFPKQVARIIAGEKIWTVAAH